MPDFRSRKLCGALADSAAQQPPFDAAAAARRRAAVAATLAKVLCCAALPLALRFLLLFAALHSRAATCASQHHVPCEELPDGALLVLGCLTLPWPFTAAAASCPNARVLERVTALLAAEQ